MSFGWVILSYGAAAVAALFLLNHFHARRWYWHVMSLVAALALGLTTMPESWRGPSTDLMIGSAFIVLFLWGAAAPLFRHTKA